MPETTDPVADAHTWLEDIDGAAALDWVRDRNADAEATLFSQPQFEHLRQDILGVLEAEDRIAYPAVHDNDVLNFWTDATHRRGVLRRTSWESYRGGDPAWDIVLDVDALGELEGESWVYQGAEVRRPDRTRALVALSPGGSDASVTRELDLLGKRFVTADDGGFVRPLSKGSLTWIDSDTVYVASDFGPGTMTRSGYPRTVRRWSRGTPIEDAVVVFEGDDDDVGVSAEVGTLPGFEHHLFRRRTGFYEVAHWVLRGDKLVRIPVPDGVELSIHGQWMIVEPRHDWSVGDRTRPAGSLVAVHLERFLDGDRGPTTVQSVVEPGARTAVAEYAWTRHHLAVNVMEDVRNHVRVARTPDASGTWSLEPLAGTPDVWSFGVTSVGADTSDDLWINATDFLTPETLYRCSIGGDAEQIRQAPHRFDPTGLTVEQHFATSADGTRVPYFELSSTGQEGPRPTLLTGYGGFEVPSLPLYSGVIGRAWAADGGTYVLANIRGGGEYGPSWHQAGLRDQRPRVYEDFEAVARNLVERGVTTPAQLGISGGSNGGLLVGNLYVRRPELFGAVVCQVPLLDMRRYPHLLAGASWIAEYGDPDDPDDWAFLRTFSPYHLVEADGAYPPILLTTSTRDDRVHPGHARKMAAALGAMGHDVTYWENIEGGHGGAADASQRATMQALVFTFLRSRLSHMSPAG